MASLRALFEELGFGDVRTFVQSGNVVFSASKAVTPARLEQAIEKEYGFESRVALRTARDLARIVNGNPFGRADVSKVHVGFAMEKPTRAVLSKLDAGAFSPEEVVVKG